MIHGLFGLAHIGLSYFHSACKVQNLSYAIISPTEVDKRMIGESLDPFPIIVLGAVNFLKLHKKFKKPVCVFIVDNPVQLEAMGATILNSSKISTYRYHFHPVKPEDIRLAIESCGKEPMEVKIRKTRVITDLLKAASAESILSPLQTAFYQIKSLEIRTRMQDTVFDYLAGRGSYEKVERLVRKKLGEHEVGKRLLTALGEKKFKRLRKAASLILAKKTTFDKASSKFTVPMYDLKYTCKKVAAKHNIVLPG